MAMELINPTSKFGSARQLGTIVFFVLMLVGIESKKINPAVNATAISVATAIGIYGTMYLMRTLKTWKGLPLVTDTERISKIVVFCSMFMIALAISEYQIACYVIVMAVIGFRGISAILN